MQRNVIIMTKNTYKKIAALLLSSLTTLSSTTYFSYAEENKVDEKYDYIEKALSKYLLSYEVDTDSVYISKPYNVYNLDEISNDNRTHNEHEVFIVFEGDYIIGMLAVGSAYGTYHSSFEYNSFDILQDIYDNEESLSFVSKDKKLYVEDNNHYYPVYGNGDSISYDFRLTQEKRLDKSYKINILDSTRGMSSIVYQKNLSVPIVQNENINGSGVCWAAVIASKANFIYHDTLSASDVYYTLDTAYSGTPVGSDTWIERGYDLFDIPYNFVSGMMNCNGVYNNIQNNNPLDLSIQTTDGAVGHGVLISGLTINSDLTGVYRLVDPNCTGYVDIIASTNMMSGNSFLYETTYGYTFTQWVSTVY